MPDTLRLDITGEARMPALSQSSVADITSCRLICWTCASYRSCTAGAVMFIGMFGGGVELHAANARLLKIIILFIPFPLCVGGVLAS